MVSLCEDWAKGDEGYKARDGALLADLLAFYDPISIDSFLTHYSNNERLITIAKLAIAQILLGKGTSVNFNRIRLRKNEEAYHWYRYLWDAIVKDQSASELANPLIPFNFDIVTFNYDPSLEYFLYSRVISSGSMFTDEQRSSFLRKISERIHHVYGCLLNYKWCTGDQGEANGKFAAPDDRALITLVERNFHHIQLINERKANQRDHLQLLIAKASQVIFLGFSFDETNIGPHVLNLGKTLVREQDGKWKRPPIVKYTNFGNSRIINERLYDLLKDKVPNPYSPTDFLVKSEKKVYRAVSEDFPLNSFN